MPVSPPVDPARAEPVEDSEPDFVTLNEEQASQGFKTGHMRWVLLIGFALAGAGLGLAALLS